MNRELFSPKPLPTSRPLFSNIEEVGPYLPDGSFVYNNSGQPASSSNWNWNQALDSGLDLVASLLKKNDTNSVVPISNNQNNGANTTMLIVGAVSLIVVALVLWFVFKK